MYIRVINNNTDVENLYNTYIKINSSILKKYPLKKFSFIDLDNKTYDKDDSFIKLIKMKFKDKINKHTLLELLTHYFLLKDIEKDESIHLNDYILVLNDNFEMGSNFNTRFLEFVKEIENKKIDMVFIGGRYIKNYEPLNYLLFDKETESLYKRNLLKLFHYENKTFDQLIEKRNVNYDRSLNAYVIKKKIIKDLYTHIISFTMQSNKIPNIDIYNYGFISFIPVYDYFPHLFYISQKMNTNENSIDILCDVL